ncbi:MAG: class I SAM-dependent methyltransferase [Actinobacteria bacterium]|nr:class I SAM-dependent methyltransferase [Actinomycetota bacterium]
MTDSLSVCANYYKKYFPNYIDISQQYEDIILKMIDKDSIIVDIGCGRTSRFAKYKNSYKRLIGIDISEEEIQHNWEVDEKIICDERKKIILPDDSVNLIVSFFVLEHIANPAKFFSEIKRVLKPSGKFVLLAPNSLYPVFFLNKFMPDRKLKEILLTRVAKRDLKTIFPVYYRANSLFAINKLRNKKIFKSIEVTYLGGPFDLHFSFFLFRLGVYFERLLRFFKINCLLPHMMIIGEK